MTDPTERLAKARTCHRCRREVAKGARMLWRDIRPVESWPVCPECVEYLDNRELIEKWVRAFAEWCEAGQRATDGLLDDATRYLASLAVKEEGR